MGLGGYDTQDTIARMCNLPKNPIRGITFAALLYCCVRTITSSNMFRRNDKKGNGAADPGGHILSLVVCHSYGYMMQ